MRNLFAGLALLLLCVTSGNSQTPYIDSLIRIVERHPGDTNEVIALDLIADSYMRTDLKRAGVYTYPQIKLAKSIGYVRGLYRGYTTLIHIHQGTGNIDSAYYYLRLYGDFIKQYPGNKMVAINYTNTAGLFYKSQGKYNEALPYLLEALRIIGPNGDKTARAGQMLNIGNAYTKLGDLKNAAAYHVKSLVLFEEVGNKRGQSFALQSLGNDYYVMNQNATAEKYFVRSAKMKEELGDRRGLVSSWQSLGEVYQRLHKPALSLEYTNNALKMARELNLVLEQRELLFNVGSTMRDQKDFDGARKAFDESMALAKKNGDSLLVSQIRTEFVMMDNDLSKEKNEESMLIENIRVSLETGARPNTAEGYHKLAEWYAAHKQFDKAYDFIRQAHVLDDSLRGNEVIVQMKRLEEEYKNDQKEKEIALLRKDQELNALALGRQQAVITSIVIALAGVIVIALLLINRYRVVNRAKRLVEIERVRNTIARDLHDDIGSTLSSINILSKVALVEQNGNTQNYLQRIGDQSERMMEEISDIVWSINPHNDSMNQAIIRMREFSSEIFESKNMAHSFSENVHEDLTLDADKRKNLFLIFKESVNNAAKYSAASQVDISLTQQDHTLVMRIKDNGVGFDENMVTSGNGLRNLRERAKEVNGTVTLKTAAGTGTEMELHLPLA